jgi:predicted metallo-beta-lactamase superfamily hydrolase
MEVAASDGDDIMKVVPLAADSLGVRSVATYVECGETRILIDPGAALGAGRFGLPPADAEWEALRRANDRISAYAERAGWVFVSHYHDEHYRHDSTIYSGRSVWAKDPQRMVTGAQAERARQFWQSHAAQARLDSADGRCIETPDCILAASPPLPHGAELSGLGHVIALTVTDRRSGQRFVHASDVQGPLSPVAAAYLGRERPSLLYLSGPPAYLEHRLGRPLVEQGVEHLLRIIDRTGCRVIMDHHAVRDDGYRDRFQRLWDTGRVVTAAGFLGLADSPLEALRRSLWAAQRKPPGALPKRPFGARPALRPAGDGRVIPEERLARRAKGGMGR